eukprot:g28756.t1
MSKGPAPSETLFVSGLPVDCSSDQAKKAFSQYGTVTDATVLPVLPGKNAAASFVVMETVDQAQWVVDNLNGNIPDGFSTPVTVVFATPRSERAPGKGSMKGMMLGLERVAEARGWSRVRKRETRKHHEH